VKAEETAVVRQRLDKHAFAVEDTHAVVEELLISVFSIQSVLMINDEDHSKKLASISCGDVVECLHRCPASRRRERKWNPVLAGITGPPCSWGI
jgi:hypothetical protein